jgi:hypothetical protein
MGSILDLMRRPDRKQQAIDEDWGTVRILCAECSRGTPDEHTCTDSPDAVKATRFGSAARSRVALEKMLLEWREIALEVKFGELTLELPGVESRG